MRRADLLWLGVVGILGGAVYVADPSGLRGMDYLDLHSLNKRYLREAVASGRLPLWNPHVGLGRPFLADIEVGAFYPPNSLYLLVPTDIATVILVGFHLVLAAAGTAALLKSLEVGSPTREALGAAFALSVPLLGRLQMGEVPFVQALCWTPVLFHAGHRVQERPSLRGAAILTGIVALQLLAGHPQVSWLALVGLATWLVGWRLGRTFRASLRALARDLALLVAAVAWASAVAAIQLLPTAELVAQGNRADPDRAFAAAFAMPWPTLVSVAVPPGPMAPVLWENNVHVGVIAALAGLAGLFLAESREARAVAALAAFAVVLALGDQTPLFGVAYHLLPGLSRFRLPARAGVLLSLALILAAGLFTGAPGRTDSRPRRGAVLALATATALLTGAVLFVYGVAAPDQAGATPWLCARLSLTLAGGAALAAWSSVRTHQARIRRIAGGVLLGLLAVDVTTSIVAVKRANPTAPPSWVEDGVRRELEGYGVIRAGAPPPRIALAHGLVRPNAGMTGGWSTYDGYVALTLGRVWSFLHEYLGIEAPRLFNTQPSPGIDHFLPRPYDMMGLVAGFDPASKRLVFWREPDPRAWVADGRSVTSASAATGLMRAGLDVHRVTLVESPVGPAGDNAPTSAGEARISRYGPERIELTADAARDAWLVLAEPWYPGWRATVDGREAPCVPANAWMRAVPLGRGHHDVVVQYRSRPLWIGSGVTLTALAALAAVLVRTRPRAPTAPA
jgi:hypothetical protein